MGRELRLDKDSIRKTLDDAGWDFDQFPLYLTMEPWDRDLELLIQYRVPIAAFRLFMKDVYAHVEDDDYSWDEIDFRGVCIGFLVALAVPPTDAFSLDTFLRYNLQYFDVDPAIKLR